MSQLSVDTAHQLFLSYCVRVSKVLNYQGCQVRILVCTPQSLRPRLDADKLSDEKGSAMECQIESTPLREVLVLTPGIFKDARGYFTELFRADNLQKLGIPHHFVQINESASKKNVVRGLHFQWDPPMGKLMRVSQGVAFLVAVDIRKGSPTLGKWVGTEVSAENRKQVWAPASFARGFCALADNTVVEYLCTGIYDAKGESGIRWNDSNIAVHWPVEDPLVSEKDRTAQSLSDWLASPQSEHFKY